MTSLRLGRLAACALACALLPAASPVAAATPRESFTVVAVPDTQRYSEKLPGTFLAQTAWIVAMRERERIAFVTHLGDLVEHSDRLVEWTRADTAMRVLDGVLPYGACSGNHDARTTNDTVYFGPARYAGRPWYLGSSPNGRNHAQTFEAGGYRFLHLTLQFGPRDEAFAWARQVVKAHPGCPTIVSTHDNLVLTGRSANGQALWDGFVADTPQVFLVLNGHTHGEFWQVSPNATGGRVIEILSDYQDNPNGGDGDLRLLRFDVPRNRLEIETYSPLLDRAVTNDASRFGFDVAFAPDAITVRAPVGPAPRAAANVNAAKRPTPSMTVQAAAPPPASEPPPEAGTRRLRFRQGADGYAGATDTWIGQATPSRAAGGDDSLSVDADEPSGSGLATRSLLRFGELFGAATNQVPAGATVVAARLTLRATNAGSGFSLYRMAAPWDATVTWASFPADALPADAQPDLTLGRADTQNNVAVGRVTLDVTPAIRAWQAGAANHGWLLAPFAGGSNGIDFASAESDSLAQRPELTIDVR